MKIRSVLLLLCLGVAAAHPDAALSQPLPVLLRDLLDAGEYDEARVRVRQAMQGEPDGGLHVAHLEGVIFLRQGRDAEALAVFRRILAVEPDFEPSRVELARLLYRMGDHEGANIQFETIALGSDDIALRRFATQYIRAMERERPSGFSGYLSILPTTNINRGTANRQFVSALGAGVIDESARQTSGLGAGAGATAFRTWTTGPRSAVNWSVSGDLKTYRETRDFDDLSLSTNLAFSTRVGGVSVSAGPVFEYRWAGWEPYWWRSGLAVGGTLPVGERTAIGLSATYLRQDYFDQDFRDGWVGVATASLRHMLSPSLSIGASAGFIAERTRLDHLDHDDYRLSAQVGKEWSGGLTTIVFAGAETHLYRGEFPLTGVKRKDERFNVGTFLTHKALEFKGFAPQIKYEYTRQYSNISFFDFESHDVGLSLTKRF